MERQSAKTWLSACLGVLGLIALLTSANPVRGNDVSEEVPSVQPEAIRADMAFLADDLLEGRATGTRGYEIAAKFMASQFEAMGLEPAGEHGTYFQNVPLRSTKLDEEHTAFSVGQGGKEQVLAFRNDFVAIPDPARTETSVEAPVVYVGFGVTAPEQNYDDYASVAARGRIVAYFYGAPPQFQSTIRAHYSSSAVKAANAAAHGAVGIILLDSPTLENLYPFKARVRDLAFPDMYWLDTSGRPNDYFPELRGRVVLNMTATSRLFEGTGRSVEQMYSAAKDGKPASFSLALTAKMKTGSTRKNLQSPNVVARLPGSDPVLRAEHVVYSAHLDHLGIGEPVNGDAVYNGALDNASGSACLLEIARAYSHIRPAPRRSILFLSLTGEEEGLLGSGYFAQHPTVPQSSLVADINMDGATLLWPMEDVIVYGAEHSTLDAATREAGNRLRIEVTSDPQPEQVLFIRSDQYSFVKQGIPSVFPHFGVKSSDANINPTDITTKWRQTIYHTPQDDMSQPFDFESGAKYAQYSFLLGYLVAQKTQKPAWNPEDFFEKQYPRRR